MLDIQFGSKWKIGSDPRQFIIYEKFGNTWKAMYFYASFDNLLAALLELDLTAKDITEVNMIREELKAFKKWVVESHFTLKSPNPINNT